MNCNLCFDTGHGYTPGTFCHCAAGRAKLDAANAHRAAVLDAVRNAAFAMRKRPAE